MRTLWACVILLCACTPNPRDATPSLIATNPNMINELTPEETSDGFRLLFDGNSSTGWRAFGSDSFPVAGWYTEDGELRHTEGGGDIITEDQFANFELRLEWRIGVGGNSGVFFWVTEDVDVIYQVAPEMQVLDDLVHPDGRSRLTSAGSNYGLHASPEGFLKPVGEWNAVRLIVNGPHVEHWLNGFMVVQYELWTQEWEALVGSTKFSAWPGYGRATLGHIGLQDHGDPVSYRSIRVRELH